MRAPRGAELPQTKLTETQVREARHLHATTTAGVRALAARYGVSRSTMADLLAGRTWAWVQ